MDADLSGGTRGQPWTQFEIEAVVSIYLRMLDHERRGERYSKSRLVEEMMALSPARSRQGVEYKLANISAILDQEGYAWVDGYKPRSNVQAELRRAVLERVRSGSRVAESLATYAGSAAAPAGIFDRSTDDVIVPPPDGSRKAGGASRVAITGSAMAAFRDFQAKQLGDAGEEWVLSLERRRLLRLGRPDLADKVRWTAREDGDGAGYDVTSFFPDGRQRLIEVKTTNYGVRTPFYITRWEVEVSEKRAEEWSLYRVHGFARDPRLYILDGSVSETARLEPKVYLGLPI